MVVPLAPGGSNDILSRLVGAKLEKKFGKPVIIENRPAGGGIPAALGVVRSAARRLHADLGDEHLALVQHHGAQDPCLTIRARTSRRWR